MKLSCVRRYGQRFLFFSVFHRACALNWTATRCWLRLTFLPQRQLHADTPPWKMHIVLISSGKLTVDCPLWSSCSCTTSSIFQVARVCPGYDGSHLLELIAVGGYPDLTTAVSRLPTITAVSTCKAFNIAFAITANIHNIVRKV